MNDLRKAAEMALETLCVGANDVVPNDIDERFEQAIQALRQALAQPEQEPEWVATIGNWGKVQWREDVFPHLGAKLYSAPPKCEWVGLTDEDKHYLNEVLNLQGRFPVIDAIEAKLKEKNT